MKIALDYDETYTRDPALFDCFIAMAVKNGHDLRIVTSRFPSEEVPSIGPLIYYTSRKPKGQYLANEQWLPDIWIDDAPQRIFGSGAWLYR
jgi:hypothetical protein